MSRRRPSLPLFWPTATIVVLALTAIALTSCGQDDPQAAEIADATAQLDRDSGPDRRSAAGRLEKLLAAAPGVERSSAAGSALARLRGIAEDDRDEHVRAAAIRALAAAHDSAAQAVVSAALAHSDPAVRREAIQALVAIVGASAAGQLAGCLDDAVEANRMAAAIGLAGCGEPGLKALTGHLAKGGGAVAVAVAGIEACSLPAARDLLLSGLSSDQSPLRLAGLRAAASGQVPASVIAVITALLKSSDQNERRAAAEALAAIATPEALASLLPLAATQARKPQAVTAGSQLPLAERIADLLAKQPERTRAAVLHLAALPAAQRGLGNDALARLLIRFGGPAATPILADLARPEEPMLTVLVKHLATAPAEVRAPVAERLRGALPAVEPGSDRSLALVAALAQVGQPGPGPDGAIVLERCRAALAQVDAIIASGALSGGDTYPQPGNPDYVVWIIPGKPNATKEELDASRRRSGLESYLLKHVDALARLAVPAGAELCRGLLKHPNIGLRCAGIRGVLAVSDDEGIVQVNQLLLDLRLEDCYGVLMSTMPAFSACRDPRVLPGLKRWMTEAFPDVQPKVYEAVAAMDTREAIALLFERLADPAMSADYKSRFIGTAITSRNGPGSRAVLLDLLRTAAPPATAGDPDPGWWSAGFLRQMPASFPELVRSFRQDQPTGAIAARYVHALDLADDTDSLGCLAALVGAPDPDLRLMALGSLVRHRRVALLPELERQRAAATDPAWKAKLQQAITAISAAQTELAQGSATASAPGSSQAATR
ncbi:hypothetical protein LBMAG53_01900 [Planctomycetota bacterium]|nr:hypothetical protein LBMAG53_01900 [Planctomycetota bacterium]